MFMSTIISTTRNKFHVHVHHHHKQFLPVYGCWGLHFGWTALTVWWQSCGGTVVVGLGRYCPIRSFLVLPSISNCENSGVLFFLFLSSVAFAGRLRSNISVFQRILRTESVLAQRTVPQRSYGIPDFALAKWDDSLCEFIRFTSCGYCFGLGKGFQVSIHPGPHATTATFQCCRLKCLLGYARNLSLRNYASAPVSKEEKFKVPLALFGVSGNYASALFLAASMANTLDKVESEILDIVEASKKSPVFSQFIKDLSVLGETRVKAVQEIFSEAGFSDITKNFLAVLAENGRLRHIESIAKSFVELTMAHRGEVLAIVTAVIPIPLEEEKQLKETLQDIFGRGKTVKLEQKINQSILGGLVVEFGQKLFDMSIRTRVRQMEKLLRDPVNFQRL
ncbi:hypothetical protein MRB53_017597 [Persea americana]|uniref:Uncharacterized protein n=1 Tax=Persea americana TaxID=3435 RepID=A0ACC2M617_PERAE|nr:hypothetical protein MRB53_017597 [Persea americana]